jgi:hypothetical protein
MKLLRLPEHPGSSVDIADQLAATPEGERRVERVRRRGQAADFRRRSRRTQATIRLADTFAKLGSGSLFTATLLLLVNGQVNGPVVLTATSALLVFVTSTISLVAADRRVAEFDHAADVIEAALKETER